MKRTILGVLGALSVIAVASPATAQGGGCTRERLEEVADQFRASQADGKAILHLKPMGEWVSYYENGELSSMTFGGLISTPQKVDWDRALLDTVACSVYVESIITNPEHPYVAATIIAARGAIGSPTGTIARLDAVVTDKDDWLFNAEKTLYYAQREDWGVIPEAERDTREVIQAAADAYLDLFSDKSVQVPWGTPCARLEGSVYTGKGQATDSCNVGVPENVPMVERRYVIDPARGAVAVFLLMGENRRPDVHTFRVEDGKIRFIHTITNCGEQVNCGFDPFEEMVERNPDMWPNLDHLPVVSQE